MSGRPAGGERIAILGAGSLGCAIGGTLAAGGLDVLLVSRRADHVRAILADGLCLLTETGAERVVRVAATASLAGLPPVGTLVVLVKSPDTAAAVAAARAAVGPDTLVLTLQNGLGNEQVIGELVGPERVAAGRTWIGGQLLGPGRVFAQLTGKRTVVGELDGSVSPRMQRLAAAWSSAGVLVEVTDRMPAVIWDKLLTNVATGAISAITGLAVGELYAVPALERVGTAAVREAMAVAAAAGVELSTQDARGVWLAAGGGRPADFRPSMLQSIDAGARTEVDVVNGAVCRWGARLGVPTPVNDTLWAAVVGRERAFGH